MRVLAINPGSTSTKIAVFEDGSTIFETNIKHSSEDLSLFKKISDQYHFRRDLILKELRSEKIDLHTIDCIVGRGGLIKPVRSGIYRVNERMKEDLRQGILGEHASNLGGLIADDIAAEIPGAEAFIADPVVVDEMENIARISGHPEFERISIFHALNQKATGRIHAREMNTRYEDLNLIIAHLGGGISVGAHKKGKVIDVNNALDGEGPFSPERSGTLPAGALVKTCFSGRYSETEIRKMIKGAGGFVAYLGTNDAYDVEMRARSGDEKARFIQDALCYQLCKEIGAMSTVLEGKVDAILLTGGMARNQTMVEYVREKTSFIAPIHVYPGEDELRALAMNGFRLLRGEAEILDYA